MEGLTLDESTQAMILSVARGERTLEECLEQINAKYAIESALDEADRIAEQSDSRYSFDEVFGRVRKRTREDSNS